MNFCYEVVSLFFCFLKLSFHRSKFTLKDIKLFLHLSKFFIHFLIIDILIFFFDRFDNFGFFPQSLQ